MTCFSSEIIAGFVAAGLDTETRAAVEAHIERGCAVCEREVARFEGLRKIDLLEDPPPWVLARAAAIPRDLREGRLSRLLGVAASVVFDTFRDPLPAGARSTTSAGRQLLYRALDYDVDVRLDAAGGGLFRVTGQVLPGPDRPLEAVAGVDVALTTNGRTVATCATNEIGEFVFESVAEGEYTITLDMSEEILLIERVTLESN
jgi:hypothetical protein